MLSHIHNFFFNPNELKNVADSMSVLIGFINVQCASAVLMNTCWPITIVACVLCHMACFIYFTQYLGYELVTMINILITNMVMLIYLSIYFEKTLKYEFLQARELERMHQQLRDLIEYVPEGILIFNNNTNEILLKNNKLVNIFSMAGLPKQEQLFIQQENVKSPQQKIEDLENSRKHINAIESQKPQQEKQQIEDISKLNDKDINELLSKPCLSLYDFKKKQTIKKYETQEMKKGKTQKLQLFNIFTAATQYQEGDQCFIIRNRQKKRIALIGNQPPAISTLGSQNYQNSSGANQQSYFTESASNSQLDGREIFTVKQCPVRFKNQEATMVITQCLTSMVRSEKASLLNHFYAMLTATFSHELLSPMNTQLNLLENVAPYVNGQGKILLDLIMNSNHMLLFFINDILDIFKIKQGHFDKHEAPFDVRACVNSLRDMIQRPCSLKNIKVISIFTQNVPDKIIGDENRLKQVLHNLLQNALKFSIKGQLTITVDYDYLTSSIEIDVADQGIGISDKQQRRLFKLFQNIENPGQNSTHGIGLGLYICRKLCNQYNGAIQCQSIPNVGTTFRFSMVMKEQSILEQDNEDDIQVSFDSQQEESMDSFVQESEQEDDDDENEAEEEGSSNEDSSQASVKLADLQNINASSINDLESCNGLIERKELFTIPDDFQNNTVRVKKNRGSIKVVEDEIENANQQGPNILVVDDNVFNVMTLKMLLEARFGLPTDKAMNGLEAMQMVKVRKNNPYQLIFMDCNMPLMDGLEATSKILDLYSSDPQFKGLKAPYIVALTAYNTQYTREQCKKVGMKEFLTKPADPEAIQKLLQKLSLI